MGGLHALGASLTRWSEEDVPSFGAISADAAPAVANRVMPKQSRHQWVSHLIRLQTQSTDSASFGSTVINWAILRCGSGSRGRSAPQLKCC